MRLASFTRDGKAGFGAVTEEGIVDLTGRIDGAATLAELLEKDGVSKAKAYADGRKADFALDAVRFLPVIPAPSKIICVGLNYLDHAAEASLKVGAHPVIFHRYPESMTGHNEPLIRPKVSDKHDYEGELAVIMGRTGRHIPAEKAMDYVAGYACFNDSSIRDWQFHTNQYGMGKNFLATGGFGPWMTTADEIPDYREAYSRNLCQRRAAAGRAFEGSRLRRAPADQLCLGGPALASGRRFGDRYALWRRFRPKAAALPA